MTAVKIGYPLISVTWLYRRLKYLTHWRDEFFLSFLLTIYGIEVIVGSEKFTSERHFIKYMDKDFIWYQTTTEYYCLQKSCLCRYFPQFFTSLLRIFATLEVYTRASLLALAKSIYKMDRTYWYSIIKITGLLTARSCDSSLCLNGGTCSNLRGKYSCQCRPDWTGARCGGR